MALIDDIEVFLLKHEISATSLGDRALGDRHFVRQLRSGREVWPRTERKVRAYMDAVASSVDREAQNAALQHGSSTGQASELSGAPLRGAA